MIALTFGASRFKERERVRFATKANLMSDPIFRAIRVVQQFSSELFFKSDACSVRVCLKAEIKRGNNDHEMM